MFGLHTPKIYNVYFLAIVATMGGMLFGFDISSMSAQVGTSQYIDYFDNPHGVMQGAIGSALAAGSVLGSIIAGPLSDKLGRRDSIFWSNIFWLVGTSVQASVQNRGQLIAGRFLNGVTVGVTSSQVPVYLAEVAKHDKRGAIIVIQQLAIEWGIFIMFFIGYGCSFIEGPASFRTAWGCQFIPSVALVIGLLFLPESPRWLAAQDRVDEAIEILANIQAGGNKEDPMVIAEWEEITTTLQAERAESPGWRKFVHKGMWKRTLAGFTVQAWQQMSGANVIVYYIVYVFKMAGLSGNINLIASGVQYALFIVCTSIVFFFIDKTGRRPLLIYGALGMALCHFVVAAMIGGFGVSVPEGVDGDLNVTVVVSGSPSHTIIAFSYLLIMVYAFTLAPVAWVYAAEVWSLGTRATGMSIAAIGNWIFNFALGLFTPPGISNIGYGLFVIFGVLCVLAAVQAFFTYPETCGKTLEEIEVLFRKDGPKPWKTRPGDSRLDAEVRNVLEAKERGLSVSEYVEKVEEQVQQHESRRTNVTEVTGDNRV